MKKNIKLLDCTLRDGGYYNNWDFSPDLIKDYLEAMVSIQADYIEIGFRFIGNNGFKGGCAFSTDRYIESLNIPHALKNKIGVMVNGSDILSQGDTESDIPKILEGLFAPKQQSPVSLVRIACHINDFDVIKNLIKDKDIFIFEDNCESMGAEYKGKQTGTFGIVSTFSTFFSHHMATMEGGFVTTDDEELYHVLLSLRAHGWTRNLPQENHVTNKSYDWFEESFRFVLPGYNVRPVEMSGAIGIEQLKKLPSFLKQRRENAKLFVELFKGHSDFIIQKDMDNSSWFGFSLIIRPDSNLKRKDIIHVLQENNIDCRPIVTGNFTKNDVMKFFDYEIHKELKNADYLHENGFFVGNSQVDLKKEIRVLYETILQFKRFTRKLI